MIFLLLIEDDKVHIIETEQLVANKYNYLPSEEDTPIVFPTYEEAESWAIENVKPEYLALPKPEMTDEELRHKYLKV